MIKQLVQGHKTCIAETDNVGYCMLNAKIRGKVN